MNNILFLRPNNSSFVMQKGIIIPFLIFIWIVNVNISNCQVISPSGFDQYQDSLSTELSSRVGLLESNLEKINRLKISGYTQVQYLWSDTAGSLLPNMTYMPTKTDQQFQIRRARLKATYEFVNLEGITLTSMVLQFNGNANGVTLVDAYGKVLDPWIHWFGFKAGLYNRPFGYELAYSSSNRETVERGRMSSLLFLNERDLGASILIGAPKTSPWNWVRLEAGLFTGVGLYSLEVDRKKDFIGQLVFTKSNLNETVRFSGGISYYKGGNIYGNKYHFEIADKNGQKTWHVEDSTQNPNTSFTKREYFGADAQVSFENPLGLTTLRGEVIFGTHPGLNTTSLPIAALTTANMYNRKFNGAYFYFVQNILHSKHNIVVKYDWLDPNTEVKGAEIANAASTGFSLQDIKFNNLSLGYVFNFDHTWKFMVTYEMIKNEITSLPNYNKDIKDNLVTFRMQYRFNNI